MRRQALAHGFIWRTHAFWMFDSRLSDVLRRHETRPNTTALSVRRGQARRLYKRVFVLYWDLSIDAKDGI